MSDIQVVQRVADILEAFSPEVVEVRLASLARELEVQRSTLHRYLTSMEHAGLLERSDGGAFRLGPVMRNAAIVALESGIDAEMLTRVMTALTQTTRVTTVRSLWSDLAPVVVEQAEPDTATHVMVRLGTRLPYTAAQTHVFLAFDPGGTRRGRVLSLLPAAERRALEERLTDVQSSGFAISEGVDEGVRAIAAPVLNGAGSAIMALAMIGTTVGVPGSVDSDGVRALARAAAELSRRAGYAQRHPAAAHLGLAADSSERNSSPAARAIDDAS